MTETQTLPHFPPPQYHDYSTPPSRRLPQPIQLPPLTIPQVTAHRTEYNHGSGQNQPLPSIQPQSGPGPRALHRSYSGSGGGAPLEKLLSPHPFTPPRSDAAYSPRSPPRSAIDTRPPPPLPNRSVNEKYYEDQRHHHESQYQSSSPVEPHRQSYSTLPSPAPSYAPSFASSNASYRQAGVPPPPSTLPHSYTSGYSEPGPIPPPPRIPPSGPAPQHAVAHHQHLHQHPSQHQSQHAASPHVVQQAPPPDRRFMPSQQGQYSSPYSTNDLDSLKYELRVRQQPIAARACGFGERDRRVIDPPPIIQLMVTDPKTGQVDLDELRYSLNVVHCTLWNADGSHEETALVQPDRRTTRRLMGQLVASPSVAKDEHDVEGCFFCFPDLSCRTNGKYRLRFILMRIDPVNLHVGGFSPILTEVLSDVFTVYTAKDFPGMRPSSALTRALKLQGCNIQVKKGNEKALARKRSAASVSEGDDDDPNKEGGGKKKRAK
ncbi:velvet factor-domain-containing protein [Venturia nashicola]|uniref:Velvet factor-domain-containing protein n=1 Tax=Venturia nashicola TaxID=86259 RepID=A0A4Z1NHI3_9PEZI|nr:velvet factor-domain-containing protein [Venturia nashicola]